MLRLPDGLKAKIAALAEANGRSMNSELIDAALHHLERPSRLDAIEAFIEKHRKMLDQMSEYDWFGKDGIIAEIGQIQNQLSELDEVTRPERYADRD